MRLPCGTWRAWAAVVVVLVATDSARAFYWADWPGSRLRVEQTLITPPNVTTPGNPPPPSLPPELPPFQPPPGRPPREPVPPVGPEIPVDRPPLGPEPTPEPATGLLGLLGLGALAAVRKWRRKAY